MDPRSSRLPLLVLLVLILGIGLGAATMWLFGVSGAVSLDSDVEIVMPLPAGLNEVPPAPTEMIHGVDRHSPGPGALPEQDRARARPPVELFTKLLQASVYGRVPVRAADGSTSLRTYSAPEPERVVADGSAAVTQGAGARVAIAVVDLGLDQQVSRQSVALPWPVSFAVTPYIATAPDWQRFMRWHGHEVFTMLPIEALDPENDDQGALAIPVHDDQTGRLDRLDQVMSRGSGYVGLAGAARGLAAGVDAFAAIADDLQARGLGFMELDGRFLEPVAREAGLPYISMTMALDEELTPASIDARLDDLERLALANGFATAYTGPVPVVLDRIWNWSRDLSARGVTLVPATSLMVPEGGP